ncbi:methylated-DNA--[protein]-cysteine S-methyltransferase [Cellulomonas sp. PhB150]|uniref:methylated-DNA--[protein]-cysteine S-methyltransferase n=1 Tax=Cellulomonas sp. PhB150 TaxID=2485188 RepID=UPI000FAEFA0E|nr:methylated-DNA--[protein]-cysteine S-methyltransferase [Cellulomonas sp. PhB150]ROS31296.1 methylated-DNA-[protein]-cysteine S-methyltransferase [Cellulomonas sp. PhB150]
MTTMTADTLHDLAGPAGVVTHTVVPSPVGPVTLVATDGVLSKLLLPELDGSPARGAFGTPADDGFEEPARQLAEYFAGIRTSFDLPLHLVGSAFQRRVWEGLMRIPYGETRSYGQLAVDVGLDPRTASRAVGAANGRNPLAIVVPCHRVIGADGSLTGYAGGIERKRFLLDLEATRLF